MLPHKSELITSGHSITNRKLLVTWNSNLTLGIEMLLRVENIRFRNRSWEWTGDRIRRRGEGRRRRLWSRLVGSLRLERCRRSLGAGLLERSGCHMTRRLERIGRLECRGSLVCLSRSSSLIHRHHWSWALLHWAAVHVWTRRSVSSLHWGVHYVLLWWNNTLTTKKLIRNSTINKVLNVKVERTWKPMDPLVIRYLIDSKTYNQLRHFQKKGIPIMKC